MLKVNSYIDAAYLQKCALGCLDLARDIRSVEN